MPETGAYFRSVNLRRLFAAAVVLAVTAAVFVGINLGTGENRIIIPVSPFENSTFAEGVLKVCFFDMASFWILSLPLRDLVKIVTSVSLFSFRGLVFGNAIHVFFANSVSDGGILLLTAYGAVTLLLLIYDGFLNGGEERGSLCRLASCLVATGGAAVIRLLPMVLIK